MTTSLSSAGISARPSADRRYGARWRRVPRNLAFLLPGLLFWLAGFIAVLTLAATGAVLLVLGIGILVLLAACGVARAFAGIELRRLEAAGRGPFERPVSRLSAEESRLGPLSLRRLAATARDPHRWAELLHALVVAPIMGLLTWTLTVIVTANALVGTSSALWAPWAPPERDSLGRLLIGMFGSEGADVASEGGAALLTTLLNTAVGVLLLALLPILLDSLVDTHSGWARLMLSRFPSDDLVAEVSALSDSRRAAVAAENVGLRRLERDIHDGPQQRLIRLQMDLAAAERALQDSPASAVQRLREARVQAGDALDELRALSRGMAPPLLQDRGLLAALEAMAADAPVAVSFQSSVPADTHLPEEVELGAYYVASELLANALKHARAQSITLELRLTGSPENALLIALHDDGQGGARAVAGHGLAGLQERLRGLRGSLTMESPVGGPSVARAHIPLG